MNLQCRAGIERAGASRAGDGTTNPVVIISGVDRTSAVQQGTLSLNLSQNDTPSTGAFTIQPNANYIPSVDEIVYVSIGSANCRRFGGQILHTTVRYAKGVSNPWVDCELIDFTRLLDRRAPLAHYQNRSATDIAFDLVAQFTSGFRTDSIAAGLPIIDDFPVGGNDTVTSAFRKLAKLVGGGFYVDPWQVIHLWGTAGDRSPRAQSKPMALTSSEALLKDFTSQPDSSQRRTRVIVDGYRTTALIGTPASTTVTGTPSVDFLIVGGGGGGGNGTNDVGAGGGAGGVLQGTDVLAAGAYSIVVGGGGTGGASATAGADSSFNLHVAKGGGFGGQSSATVSAKLGGDGGCGGGSSSNPSDTRVGHGTAGQGYDGGYGDQSGSSGAGGGGGAAGPGGNASGQVGAPGGPGVFSAISGTPSYYAGGGGGNGTSGFGAGGVGGGGRGGGGGNPAVAGTANTGGGGGGGNGANGGSGVVILSYVTGALSATGGTITTDGTRTVHTFTSNGTFTVSTVTTIIAAPVVTDLPIQDPTRLSPIGGVVRIANLVLGYTSLGGPTITPGSNLPGSSLSADVAIGATAINVTSASTIFTSSPGWADLDGQKIRFTGTSATQLTGIPASGFGSITAAAKTGVSVSWLPMIVFSSGFVFDPVLAVGEAVVQRLYVNDLTAQAAVAAIEGGDGIHDYYVDDDRLNLKGMQSVGQAELYAFSPTITSASWQTEDLNAAPGVNQTITMAALSTSVPITDVRVEFPVDNYVTGLTDADWTSMAKPRRTCTASTSRPSTVLATLIGR